MPARTHGADTAARQATALAGARAAGRTRRAAARDGAASDEERIGKAECAAAVSDAAGPTPLPVADPAAVGDLAAATAERHDWLASLGRPQRDVTHGSYQRRADLEMSTTDPDATCKRRDGGKPHLGYQTHILVDGGKARIILQTLVAPAEVTENQPMLDLLWRARFPWRLRPRQVTGDTKYGTVENIKAIADAGIRAYLPLADNDKRTPLFGKRDFTYDPERDTHTCPHGAVLPFTSVSTKDQLKVYYADRATCNACPLKARCTTTDQGRRLGAATVAGRGARAPGGGKLAGADVRRLTVTPGAIV